jgi:AbrB family looped-hinge helix DNA binding protein
MWVMLDVTHMDARGRIVLPAAVRAQLGLTEGTELLIEVDNEGSLHLRTRAAAARALIGIAGSEPGGMEELWAMRREERAKEEAFLNRYELGNPEQAR